MANILYVGALSSAGSLAPTQPPGEAADYLARSPHRAHLMRLIVEIGWKDVHQALGKL
jgi:hypothetical protein